MNMVNWWNELNSLQQLFTCFAIPATLILIIQIILFIVGLSDGGGDADADADVDVDVDVDVDADANVDADVSHSDLGDAHDSGAHDPHPSDDKAGHHDLADVKLFTLRSVVAFFAVGGWTGVVLGGLDLPVPAVVLLSLLAGWAALYFVTWSIRMALRLQYSGNVQITNAIGKIGEVYITIPASNKGHGKINVTVQERFCEFDAVTSAERDLKTGESVFVTGVAEDNVLTVIPNDEVIVR